MNHKCIHIATFLAGDAIYGRLYYVAPSCRTIVQSPKNSQFVNNYEL